jgi:hypothetical protein
MLNNWRPCKEGERRPQKRQLHSLLVSFELFDLASLRPAADWIVSVLPWVVSRGRSYGFLWAEEPVWATSAHNPGKLCKQPGRLPAEGRLRSSENKSQCLFLLPAWPNLHMCHLFGIRSLVSCSWFDSSKFSGRAFQLWHIWRLSFVEEYSTALVECNWARRVQTQMPQNSESNLRENHIIEKCKEEGCANSWSKHRENNLRF